MANSSRSGGVPESVTDLESVDWTFAGAETSYLTHGIHPYPARMIPQIPATLLQYFIDRGVVSPGDRVFDPFAGSGTTAVEARLRGFNVITCDVNPFACLLTRTKAIPVDPDLLEAAESEVTEGLTDELAAIRRRHRAGAPLEYDRPSVREGWFPEPHLAQLVAIRERIDRLEADFSVAVARPFRVALARTTREASFQRNGEFKRYRIPEDDRSAHDPDVESIFMQAEARAIEAVAAYSSRVDPRLETSVHRADAREAEPIASDSADIVITSPPYGDHDTTVAYGQFSQDPAIVAAGAGYEEMRAVDKSGLGGVARSIEPSESLEAHSPSLGATLDALRSRNGRASDALEFFTDYFAAMEQVRRVLKPGQPVAWVVANRTMSRVSIPTHLITRELCEHLEFAHVTTLAREIPSKTLPWANAPENVPGRTGELMAEEYVVIMTAP